MTKKSITLDAQAELETVDLFKKKWNQKYNEQ